MAAAYPAGPQLFVTDLAPNCATCHSMLKAEYTPERPPDSSTGELPTNKHYKAPSNPPIKATNWSLRTSGKPFWTW